MKQKAEQSPINSSTSVRDFWGPASSASYVSGKARDKACERRDFITPMIPYIIWYCPALKSTDDTHDARVASRFFERLTLGPTWEIKSDQNKALVARDYCKCERHNTYPT